MKYRMFLIGFFAAFITFLVGCGKKDAANADLQQVSTQPQQDYYTCPMHPSVISDRPGACPVCGMALVKKSAQQEMKSGDITNLKAVSLSPTQRVLANITTAPIERRTLTKEITAVGVVDIAEPLQVTVSARFRGRIEKLFVNFTGETVQKGQPLFELYSPDLVTAEQEFLLSFEALRKARESNDEQTVQVQQQLLNGVRERLRIHFGMAESQTADLEKTKQIRTSISFLSPIRGTVVLKEVVEGQYVDEGMVLYQVVDLSKVWVYIDVYEKDIRYVKIGQRVQVTTEAYPNESFNGTVTFIDPTISGETRTVRVRTELTNPYGKLKPKMYVTASFKTQVKNALFIPASAALVLGKRTVAWVEVKENTFEPRDIVLGTTSDSHYEVLKGLRDGDVIATTGGFLIDSESSLQQPSSADPHAGHGTQPKGQMEPQQTESKETHEHSALTSGAETNVNILVKGRYNPEVIRVKQGQNVHLHFYRDEDSDCTNEVVFDDFKIRRRLPARKTTTININPKEAGEYHFTCGMGMVHGKLIVEQ